MRGRDFVFLIIGLVIGGVAVRACMVRSYVARERLNYALNPVPPTPPTSTRHEVRYEVSGRGPVTTLHYKNETGGDTDLTNVALPWNLTISDVGPNFWAAVVATSGNRTGSVQTSIYLDGQLWKTKRGDGPNVMTGTYGFLKNGVPEEE